MNALKTMIQQIIDDKTCLQQACFRKALAAVACDFVNFSEHFNGGNDRDQNLCRAGKTLRHIETICCFELESRDYNWPWILELVEWIAEPAWFDFVNNTIFLQGRYGHVTDQFGEQRSYQIMPVENKPC